MLKPIFTLRHGLLLVLCWQIGLPFNFAQSAELASSQPVSLDKALFDEANAEKLFKSRLKTDTDGKPDLTPLYGCESRESLPPPVSWSFDVEPVFTMQSAPEISANKGHFLGRVVIRDGRSKISAEEVVLDRQLEVLKANGGVSIENSDAFFSADDLLQDQKSNKTYLENAWFYLFSKHANGNAEKVEINTQSETRLEKVSFTTCPLSDNSWSFSMSKMTLNTNDGWGEAWDTTLKLADVPVFYFPYINFPIDERRKTGLLAPVFRSNDINGFDYTQPIYWNIAPDRDATFFPRIIQNRGFQLGTEARWLTGSSSSEVYFEALEKDRLANQVLKNRTNDVGRSVNVRSSQRWLAQLKHHTQLSDHWQFELETQRVSDRDYLADFNSGVESTSQTRLSSQARLGYQDNIWDIELLALTHQSLIDRQGYRYLPSLSINGDFFSESNFRWQLYSEWSLFEHKELNQLEGSRAHINPSVSYPLVRPWGFFTPKVGYQYTEYHQKSQITQETQSISRRLPTASLDAGLHFERTLEISDKSYTHSLSPRIFYNYIPKRDQQAINVFDTNLNSYRFDQLWRENRFSGLDRIGDADYVSVAVANSLIKESNGDQLFHLNLGRRYYLNESQVGLNQEVLRDNRNSPWLVELESQLSPSVHFSGFLEWDQSAKQTNQMVTRLKFEPKQNYIVNLSHRYRDIVDREVEETDFSFALPINKRWGLLGRWYQDLRLDQTIDALFGVEYESCCWAIRLVAQRYLNTALDLNGEPVVIGSQKYDEGIELQFIFKGIGSLGQSGLGDLLELNINGYNDPFKR